MEGQAHGDGRANATHEGQTDQTGVGQTEQLAGRTVHLANREEHGAGQTRAERTQYQEGDQTGGGNLAYGNAQGNTGAKLVKSEE